MLLSPYHALLQVIFLTQGEKKKFHSWANQSQLLIPSYDAKCLKLHQCYALSLFVILKTIITNICIRIHMETYRQICIYCIHTHQQGEGHLWYMQLFTFWIYYQSTEIISEVLKQWCCWQMNPHFIYYFCPRL